MTIVLDGTNGITTPDVSTTAESVTGTGVWSVGGTQLYKDSSGNLGIGSTSPAIIGTNYKNLVLQGNTTTTGGYYFTQTSDASQIGQIGVDTGVIYIGARSNHPTAFTTNNTERARIDTSGNFLVGATTQDSGAKVTISHISQIGCSFVSTGTGSEGVIYFKNGNGVVGQIYTNGSATTYATSSDYRLKNNQAPLTGSGAFIDALQPKTWNWTADGSKGVGFIAHEVQAVSPTTVVGEKDATEEQEYEVTPATYDSEGKELTAAVMGTRTVPKYQAMEYGSAEFIANIVAELQFLRKRMATAEATITQQAADIAALKAKVGL